MLALFELRSPVTGYVDVEEIMTQLIGRHADDETRQGFTEDVPEEVARLGLPEPVKLTAAQRAKWTLAKPALKHDSTALWRSGARSRWCRTSRRPCARG